MNETSSTELETGTNLSQPEISIAMKELRECDWINARDEKKPRKGRPCKVYSLKLGFNDIIAQLEKQHKEDVDTAQSKIRRLKEFGLRLEVVSHSFSAGFTRPFHDIGHMYKSLQWRAEKGGNI